MEKMHVGCILAITESVLPKGNEDQYVSGSKTSQLKYQNEPIMIIITVDLTGLNVNICLELGLTHALGRNVLLLQHRLS